MKPKIKRGQLYYLVLHKRDWTYKPAVIVPVRAIRRMGRYSDWVVVEHCADSYKYRLTVHIDWLAPYDIERAKDLLRNMKMWEKRWERNSWRFRLNHKTARAEVAKAMSGLPEYQQRDVMKEFKKVYPDLLKPDGSFKVSRMKMKHWDELAWATIALKYPLKDVWEE